jgi:uncharacterized protein involved in exopolysaccharide biosynthesis
MSERTGSGLAQGGKDEGLQLDPHRLWQIVRRRRFYLVLPVLVIGAILGAGVSTITPVYTSTARILLEDRSTGTDMDKVMTQEARRVRDLENLVMVRETLMSQELLLRIIRNLRLREDPVLLQQARMLQQEKLPDQTVSLVAERLLVQRLRRKMLVGGQGGNLFVIGVEDNDPHVAFKLTEALVQGFIDEMSRRRVEGLIETTSFTDEQLETARNELREAERRLEEFKRTRLIQETLSNNPVNQQNSREAALLVRNAQLDLTENVRERQRLEDEIGESAPQALDVDRILTDPEVQNLRDRLVALERQDYLGQLAAKGVSSTGGITAERQRIGIQRNRLSERIASLVAQNYASLPGEVREKVARRAELLVVNQVLREHESAITREYEVYTNRIKEQPALEAELRRLESEVASKEEVYNRLIDAEASNELRLAANESGFGFNVRILEPPDRPLAPSKPDKRKIGLMGVILALGIGVGAVFLAEYVDTSFKDVDEVETITGLEVVGTLPRFADEYQWSKKKRRTVLAWRTAFVVTLVGIMILFVLYYRQSTVQDRVQLVGAASGVQVEGDS